MSAIKTQTVDDYSSRRSKETVYDREEPISPATVNKELRHLRAALRKATKWGFVTSPLDFAFLREEGKIPTYVTPEDFAKIYHAAKEAKYPARMTCTADDWWKGLFIFAYMTGWRISSILSLRWEGIDLDAGLAVSLARHNKGKRDVKIQLHPVVVDHLRRIKTFDPSVFPWNNARRVLFTEFIKIQRAAGVKLVGRRDHYGFHDLRRGFATMNADRLTPDMLQLLMQHKDYQTTQRYINMARQVNPAAQNLFVPELNVAKSRVGG